MKRETESGISSRFISFQGVIIRITAFGEAHRVITVIDSERGKLEISAFGSAKPKSKRRDALLVGNAVDGVAYRKAPDAPLSLKEINLLYSFNALKEDLRKMSLAFLLFETLDYALPPGETFGYYSLFREILDKIESQPHPEKYVLFFIFLQFREQGFFPSPEELPEILPDLSGQPFDIAPGSQRFLRTAETVDNLDFWDKKEITLPTQRNLFELFNLFARGQFGKPLRSLSLLRLD